MEDLQNEIKKVFDGSYGKDKIMVMIEVDTYEAELHDFMDWVVEKSYIKGQEDAYERLNKLNK